MRIIGWTAWHDPRFPDEHNDPLFESITETAAVFLIDRTGEGESLTIRALTDQDYYDICLQRKSNKWAVPQSKDELYSWYVG